MIDRLALPTWEQTAHTEAVILLCGQDLRNLLDVLPMIDETHTSRHIFGCSQGYACESEGEPRRFQKLLPRL